MSHFADIVIVGSGSVGACVAALLRRHELLRRVAPRVVILESQPLALELDYTPADLRVVACSRASERILAHAGAWPELATRRISPYERMRVWHAHTAPTSAQVLSFDAAEVGEPNLGHIIENRLLQSALLRSALADGVEVLHARLTDVALLPHAAVLSTSQGKIQTRLVIGADGAHSQVRRCAGLGAQPFDYGQAAVIATVATTRPHLKTAWQRFAPGSTLAFLPLADGRSSIVWSVTQARAAELSEMSPEQFGRSVAEHFDFALGEVELCSERVSFKLQALQASQWSANRCVLVGDAAHVVHPLAGQGFNLGLLDAAALVEQLAKAAADQEDFAAFQVLRAYERWRRSETAPLSTAIHAFDRLLAQGRGPVANLAQRALVWVNHSAELKNLFMAHALGLRGELPEIARLRPG
jgi:2-polyprenylphenol 6-hydroxylase